MDELSLRDETLECAVGMIEVEGLEFYFRFEEIVVKKSGNKTLADAGPGARGLSVWHSW
jgi:hypothetical protein